MSIPPDDHIRRQDASKCHLRAFQNSLATFQLHWAVSEQSGAGLSFLARRLASTEGARMTTAKDVADWMFDELMAEK